MVIFICQVKSGTTFYKGQQMSDYSDYCKHPFEELGYTEQLALKQAQLRHMFAPFYQQHLESFASTSQHFRMRAEFRVWHEGPETFHIMFDKHTKQKVRVDELPSASLVINKAMELVMNHVNKTQILRTKLFQIDYLSSTTNEIVISLLYHKVLDEDWLGAATELKALMQSQEYFKKVNIIGRAKKQKLVIETDCVNETLTINNAKYSFIQIENSFTQPNALININMIEWVIKHTQNTQHDLLELYCGAGNFSIPLSAYFNKVLATEISKTSVKAAQKNIKDNSIENLVIARLSSEEFVQAFRKTRLFNRLSDINLDTYNFKTVLVDPPRAGLDETTLALIANFETIVYISCNPVTLLDNLNTLTLTHEVAHLALFDQFPFTHHIESGVIMRRR